jgi:hypothetical protein
LLVVQGPTIAEVQASFSREGTFSRVIFERVVSISIRIEEQQANQESLIYGMLETKILPWLLLPQLL